MAFAFAHKSTKPVSLQSKRGRANKKTAGPGRIEQNYGIGVVGFGQPFSAAGGVPLIQAKLKIGEPNDQYEKEADRVADQVMRMPDPVAAGAPADTGASGSGNQLGNGSLDIQRMCTGCAMDEEDTLQRKPLSNTPTPLRISGLNGPIAARFPLAINSPVIQRMEMDDEDSDDEMVQMKSVEGGAAVPAVSPGVEAGVNSLKGGGRPLSQSTRAFFEPRFGVDFSGVRVHTEGRAASVAQSVQAKAFTMGRDVVFGAGEYAPGSGQGRRLLGHELTHFIQQRGTSGLQSRLDRNAHSAQAKSSAEVVSVQDMYGDVVSLRHRASTPFLQRQTTELPCSSLILAESIRGKKKASTFGLNVHTTIGRDFALRAIGNGSPVRVEIAGGAFSAYRTERCGDAAPSEIRPVTFNPLRGKSGAGIPDLAYWRHSGGSSKQIIELAEIKFADPGCFVMAETQVSNYIDKANQRDNKSKVYGYDKKGRRSKLDNRYYLFRAMPMSRFVPVPVHVDGERVFVSWCGPGVILYKALSKEDEEKEVKKRKRAAAEKAPPEIIELPFADLKPMQKRLQSALDRNIGPVPVGSEYFIIAPPTFYEKFIEEPFKERTRRFYEVHGFLPRENPVIAFRALGWTLIGITAATYTLVLAPEVLAGGGVSAGAASVGGGAEVISITALRAAAASPAAKKLAAAAGVLIVFGTAREARGEAANVSDFRAVLAVPSTQLESIAESEPFIMGRKVKYKGEIYNIIGRAVAQ